jgi:hypothetical protein
MSSNVQTQTNMHTKSQKLGENAFLADPKLKKVSQEAGSEVCLMFAYQVSIAIKSGRTLHHTKQHTIL